MAKKIIILILMVMISFTSVGMHASAKESDADLFEGYLNSLLYQTQSSSGVARSQLMGTNRILYNLLKKKISETAAGNREITEYTVSLTDLGIEQTSWTAEELGVDSILEGSAISGSAQAALQEKWGIDFSLVLKTLIADCPYELYWYDKTDYTVGPLYMCVASDTTITIASDLIFRFPVAEDYAAGDYVMDNSQMDTVNAALENIEEILEQYDAEADYEKLRGYCKEICDSVAYNDEAAFGNYAYGDPWQIINVFDGDDSTKVVCEGYAKAFQYLCDRTMFNNVNIDCLSVTGYMDGGTGAGAHMWNIVTMNNGKNYLVDVTNCDEDTIGEGEQLFLTGFVSGDVENGYVYECKSGNVIYLYDDATRSLYETEELMVADEAYEFVCSEEEGHIPCVREGKEPSCIETGLTEGSYCSVCEKVLVEQERIPKTDHTWESIYTVDKEATTTENGEKSFHCSVCDERQDASVVAVPRIKTVKLSYTKYVYDGKTKKPSVIVLDGNGDAIPSSNYAVTYEPGRKNVGKYAVKITFKEEYSGEKMLYFTIKPKATSISSLTAGGRKFTVKWNKVSTQVSGYQIRYATNSSFSKYETVTVTGASTISKSISSLNAGTKYYVKVRTFKTVDGVKYYSSWSIPKTVTPKPVATSISSLTADARKFTVKWKKKDSQVSGYQIRYATNSSFNKYKTVTVIGASSTSKSISSLNAGTKYYVKIRVYRIVDGDKHYSDWSSVKTVTPKPVGTTIKSVTPGSKKITLEWSKVSSQISGYEIQYDTNSSFSSPDKVKVSGTSTTSKIIKGLSKGKTYYVRIRTYRVVNGKTYYSEWSAKKSATVK